MLMIPIGLAGLLIGFMFGDQWPALLAGMVYGAVVVVCAQKKLI